MKALYKLLDEEKIKPIYSTLPLEQASKAHDLIESGQVKGKMLLIP
ncbi:hypothetical protein JCM19231_4289 [Vibrio ishigakensis]|uniref:Quinone oxidoreductase n=2 Tax=Vibrio ishigakensis TaxID=1481914 RepID=A0A0B8P3J4_9VIBR|nr:hypothetical protein JCM19231_4289 [Vibrio ishigakensis]